MTAAELARELIAKRIGRGKWKSRCPVHADSNPSLYITDMGGRIRAKCFACGAGGKDVMKAMGLKASDLFVDAPQANPEMRGRLRDERMLEALERQWGLMVLLEAVEPRRKRYWQAAKARVTKEGRELRAKMIDQAWEKWLATPEGMQADEQYGSKPVPKGEWRSGKQVSR